MCPSIVSPNIVVLNVPTPTKSIRTPENFHHHHDQPHCIEVLRHASGHHINNNTFYSSSSTSYCSAVNGASICFNNFTHFFWHALNESIPFVVRKSFS